MGKREIFAAAALPVVVGTILWLPAWCFLGIVAVAVTVAGDELLRMARGAGVKCGRLLPVTGLPVTLGASWYWGPQGLTAAAGALMVILPTAQLLSADRPRGSLSGAAVSSFVVLYLGLTGACVGWLRLWPGDEAGIRWLLLFLACIWVGDSGAYYVGRNLGRHRMSPRVSPNKTWEGLAGGVVTTYLAAAAVHIGLSLDVAWIHTAAVATILAAAAPVGDLVESQFKRDTGIKDSSSILPGHGGFLDRTDSLLYAAPPVLGYLLMVDLVP